MVEPLNDWRHRLGNLGVIINPANVRIDLAFNGDLHLEAVAVHLRALVRAGEIGQRLGRLETEIFDDSCAHGGSVCGSSFIFSDRQRCRALGWKSGPDHGGRVGWRRKDAQLHPMHRAIKRRAVRIIIDLQNAKTRADSQSLRGLRRERCWEWRRRRDLALARCGQRHGTVRGDDRTQAHPPRPDRADRGCGHLPFVENA